ncbi:uncharacterized protein LOC134744974 [Cydia strobilella]|uniref:uncharacterized protein LOC134744974 n=1 Tax=Cydia strobilella TaxID=1100964 RepID=UPI0030057A0B
MVEAAKREEAGWARALAEAAPAGAEATVPDAALGALLDDADATDGDAELWVRRLGERVGRLDALNVGGMLAAATEGGGAGARLSARLDAGGAAASALAARLSRLDALARAAPAALHARSGAARADAAARALLQELTEIYAWLDAPPLRDLDSISEISLLSPEGRARALAAGAALRTALRSEPQTAPAPARRRLGAVRERLRRLQRAKDALAAALARHLNNLLIHLGNEAASASAPATAAAGTARAHHADLLPYAPFMRWLKDMDEKAYDALTKVYVSTWSRVYEREARAACETARAAPAPAHAATADTPLDTVYVGTWSRVYEREARAACETARAAPAPAHAATADTPLDTREARAACETARAAPAPAHAATADTPLDTVYVGTWSRVYEREARAACETARAAPAPAHAATADTPLDTVYVGTWSRVYEREVRAACETARAAPAPAHAATADTPLDTVYVGTWSRVYEREARAACETARAAPAPAHAATADTPLDTVYVGTWSRVYEREVRAACETARAAPAPAHAATADTPLDTVYVGTWSRVYEREARAACETARAAPAPAHAATADTPLDTVYVGTWSRVYEREVRAACETARAAPAPAHAATADTPLDTVRAACETARAAPAPAHAATADTPLDTVYVGTWSRVYEREVRAACETARAAPAPAHAATADTPLDTVLTVVENICNAEQDFCTQFFLLDVDLTMSEGSDGGSEASEETAARRGGGGGGGAEARRMMAELFPALEAELVATVNHLERQPYGAMRALACVGTRVLGDGASAPGAGAGAGVTGSGGGGGGGEGRWARTALAAVAVAAKRGADRVVADRLAAMPEAARQAAKRPKAGLLGFLSEFEELSSVCEAIFGRSGRRADLERWYAALGGAMLAAVAAAEHPRTPRPVLRLENYHKLHALLAARRAQALDALRREARARYTEALRQYVTQYFGRPLDKLTQFFEGVAEAVAGGAREEEVCYRAAFSKHELRRLLAMYPAPEVRRSLHRLYRTVEKHLSEEGGLLQVVWRAMQEEFLQQHHALQVRLPLHPLPRRLQQARAAAPARHVPRARGAPLPAPAVQDRGEAPQRGGRPAAGRVARHAGGVPAAAPRVAGASPTPPSTAPPSASTSCGACSPCTPRPRCAAPCTGCTGPWRSTSARRAACCRSCGAPCRRSSCSSTTRCRCVSHSTLYRAAFSKHELRRLLAMYPAPEVRRSLHRLYRTVEKHLSEEGGLLQVVWRAMQEEFLQQHHALQVRLPLHPLPRRLQQARAAAPARHVPRARGAPLPAPAVQDRGEAPQRGGRPAAGRVARHAGGVPAAAPRVAGASPTPPSTAPPSASTSCGACSPCTPRPRCAAPCTGCTGPWRSTSARRAACCRSCGAPCRRSSCSSTTRCRCVSHSTLYRAAFSKHELRRLLAMYPAPEVRRSLHRLYRTVEKHLSEEGGLLQVVWRAMQEEFLQQHHALQVRLPLHPLPRRLQQARAAAPARHVPRARGAPLPAPAVQDRGEAPQRGGRPAAGRVARHAGGVPAAAPRVAGASPTPPSTAPPSASTSCGACSPCTPRPRCAAPCTGCTGPWRSTSARRAACCRSCGAPCRRSSCSSTTRCRCVSHSTLYRAAFSKHELRRLLAMYPAPEVRRSLHRLYRTVEKHLSEEGGLLQVVWRAMQEEFLQQHHALQVRLPLHPLPRRLQQARAAAPARHVPRARGAPLPAPAVQDRGEAPQRGGRPAAGRVARHAGGVPAAAPRVAGASPTPPSTAPPSASTSCGACSPCTPRPRCAAPCTGCTGPWRSTSARRAACCRSCGAPCRRSSCSSTTRCRCVSHSTLYRAAFSKHELRRLLAMYPAPEVRRSLHRLYRTVEKHLSEEGGLLQVVWRAMQEEFLQQHHALQVRLPLHPLPRRLQQARAAAPARHVPRARGAPLPAPAVQDRGEAPQRGGRPAAGRVARHAGGVPAAAPRVAGASPTPPSTAPPSASTSCGACSPCTPRPRCAAPCTGCTGPWRSTSARRAACCRSCGAPCRRSSCSSTTRCRRASRRATRARGWRCRSPRRTSSTPSPTSRASTDRVYDTSNTVAGCWTCWCWCWTQHKHSTFVVTTQQRSSACVER